MFTTKVHNNENIFKNKTCKAIRRIVMQSLLNFQACI